MTLTCQYCGKTMANKQNLVRHQNSKTCLATRDDDVVIENRFQCEFCNKNLCSNDRLKTHNNTCIKRYNRLLEEQCKLLNDKDKEIQEKDKIIVELEKEVENIKLKTEIELLRKDSQHKQEVIERIAEQPRTSNTNHTNNNNNTTNNLVLSMIDHFS